MGLWNAYRLTTENGQTGRKTHKYAPFYLKCGPKTSFFRRGCEATPFGEKKKYCLLKNIIIYWICRNKNRPTVGTTGCEARGDGVRPRNSCSRRLSVKQESPHFSEG